MNDPNQHNALELLEDDSVMDPREKPSQVLRLMLDGQHPSDLLENMAIVRGMIDGIELRRKAENERIRQWKLAFDEVKEQVDERVLAALEEVGKRGKPGSKTEHNRSHRTALGTISRMSRDWSASIKSPEVALAMLLRYADVKAKLSGDPTVGDVVTPEHTGLLLELAQLGHVEISFSLTKDCQKLIKERAIDAAKQQGVEMPGVEVKPPHFGYSVRLAKENGPMIVTRAAERLASEVVSVGRQRILRDQEAQR